MRIADAQLDLRRAYVGGGPGVTISGLVWTVATFVQHSRGIGPGFAALFFGGMLIFPATKILCRTVFHRQSESPDNPLGIVVLEGTFAMIGALFAAWLFSSLEPSLVFPLAAIAVGTHYFVFRTAYGVRLFWVLAGVITAIGLGNIYLSQMRGSTALLVALTELGFGLVITMRAANADKSSSQLQTESGKRPPRKPTRD